MVAASAPCTSTMLRASNSSPGSSIVLSSESVKRDIPREGYIDQDRNHNWWNKPGFIARRLRLNVLVRAARLVLAASGSSFAQSVFLARFALGSNVRRLAHARFRRGAGV